MGSYAHPIGPYLDGGPLYLSSLSNVVVLFAQRSAEMAYIWTDGIAIFLVLAEHAGCAYPYQSRHALVKLNLSLFLLTLEQRRGYVAHSEKGRERSWSITRLSVWPKSL